MHTLQNPSQVKSTNKSTKAKIKLSFQKKYSIRTATITVTIKIKPKKYQEYATALYKFSTYLFHNTHTHTFNGPFSGTTQVSQYQKGKNQSGFY